MNHRALSALAVGGLVAAAGISLAWSPRQAPAASRVHGRSAPTLRASSATPALVAPQPPSRFDQLPALRITNQTTRESRVLKLYDAQGRIDETRASELDALLCDARRPGQRDSTSINRRTLQLLFKAAYHFGSTEVEIVSGYRRPGRRREGPHGTGQAVDFRLPDVAAPELASYLRQIPRTGVGVYTHPKTRYVHLDSREHSFHWLDASPPRRHWREKSIGAADLGRRDALYEPASDLP